jgi:hypothetical protein
MSIGHEVVNFNLYNVSWNKIISRPVSCTQSFHLNMELSTSQCFFEKKRKEMYAKSERQQLLM